MRSLQKIKQSSFTPKLEIYQYLAYINNTSEIPLKNFALTEIIKICYCNTTNQFYLCNNLNLPFSEGPICLTSVPARWNGKEGELLGLFTYLRKVKESYICWMIYEDCDLGVLNLKLITSYELDERTEEFQFDECLIGIFIGSKCKGRVLSNKENGENKSFVSNGMRCKTSKEFGLCKLKENKKIVDNKSMTNLKRHRLSKTKNVGSFSSMIKTKNMD